MISFRSLRLIQYLSHAMLPPEEDISAIGRGEVLVEIKIKFILTIELCPA